MSIEHDRVNPDIKNFANIRGVGTIVLNQRHEILMGNELLAKREHQRQYGQASIPLETLKPFERTNLNAIRLAGLSEITTEANIDLLRENLREAAFDGPIKLGESGLEGALLVLHWMGEADEMPFLPAVPGEFGGLHWMEPGVAISLPNIRPYADMMIRYANERGFLNGLSSSPIPLLNKVNFMKYAAIREDKDDIK